MSRNFYSDYEMRRLIELYDEQAPDHVIAMVLGRSLPSVWSKLRQLRMAGKIDYRYPTICIEPGCTKPHYSRQRCASHYRKALRLGMLVDDRHRWCSCGQAARQSGYCLYHEAQQRRRMGNTPQGQNVAPEPAQRVTRGA